MLSRQLRLGLATTTASLGDGSWDLHPRGTGLFPALQERRQRGGSVRHVFGHAVVVSAVHEGRVPRS